MNYLTGGLILMKILFLNTKNYDKDSFEKQIANYPEIEMDYLKTDLLQRQLLWQKAMMQCVRL